jgi:alpha-beta hydrolase superfamily lysophospholipase
VTDPPRARALTLETSDGVRLTGSWWPPNADADASVVLVHGFASSSDEPRVVALAAALHDAGYAVLTYDARGHGVSGGEATIGDTERFDVATAVDVALDDSRPVIVVGASVGAIAVLHYAADAPRPIAGIVTVSCPARWRLPVNARGILSALVTQTPVGRWFARTRMNVRIATRAKRPAPPVELITRVGVPVAIVHGRADPFISPGDADDLYAAARDPKLLELVIGMGHAYEPEAIPPVLAAVAWVLRARDG